MKRRITWYFLTLAVFLFTDAVWLGFIGKDFYQSNLESLLTIELSWMPAVLFYLLFVWGLIFFAVIPALKEKSLKVALLRGAFFGLITYATYDLTNQASIKGWPVIVTVVDMLWGVFLSGTVSSAGFILGRKLKLGQQGQDRP